MGWWDIYSREGAQIERYMKASGECKSIKAPLLMISIVDCEATNTLEIHEFLHN